ncbi:hypothetical protein D3C59_33845 [Streptomyces sp. SHP22-7]|nr:hypothetical protein D3C59_36485 [Streptomyces sp. SHP22-7]RIH58278.1 hypothetical protein D3C59_36195 [Streptomyces sp. SHP22-7]RIH58630.1 hypothetical protein D3C59_33845 [Streptomyces sp. SHP22-7]
MTEQPPAWYTAAEKRAQAEAPTTPEPVVQATQYVVSCLPEGDINRRHYTLNVAYRGEDTWAVIDPPHCLSNTGDWDYEHVPSERTDEWIATHRFDLDTALRLAKEQARLIIVNGRTVTDALAGGRDG